MNSLPARAGVGLKADHFQRIVSDWPDIGFFEVHAENYLMAGGPHHHYLTRSRERYPLSIHGVGLSLGGEAPLDVDHLDRLKALLDRYQPESFSEHLAWSSHGGFFFNDLLPLPYTPVTLQRLCDHIEQTQTHLQRQILLENPATYVEFAASTMAETDFIQELLRRSGCALLLDLSNLHLSCINHQRDTAATLRALASCPVGEIHLAGFSETQDDAGAPLLLDSHDRPVAAEVWQLYRQALALLGPVATLLERDHELPPFDLLFEESQQAERLLRGLDRTGATHCEPGQ